jgi:hypothetical protein
VRGWRERIAADFDPIETYREMNRSLERAYRNLTFKEALSVSSLSPLPFLILAAGMYVGRVWGFISMAFAEAVSSGPPLGMSQHSFDAIAIILASTVAILFLGLFWAGYIGKPKNQAAAHVVQHMVTFISGALLGLKA